MNNTKVIFEYDETLKKWRVFVDGVKDNIEAVQAFNAVLLTVRTTTPSLRHFASKQQNNEYKILVSL